MSEAVMSEAAMNKTAMSKAAMSKANRLPYLISRGKRRGQNPDLSRIR
jgi:hypothetical protein